MGPQPWELRKRGCMVDPFLIGLLQWGRSLGSCGNKILWDGKNREGKLQWGRSLGSCGNKKPCRH
jgi:hypothetical protein